MRYSHSILAAILASMSAVEALPIGNVQYVTVVTTENIPENQFFAPKATSTPTATSAGPAVGAGWFGFGAKTTAAAAAAAPAPAAPAAPAAAAATTAASANSGSLFSDAKSLFDFLLGYGDSSPSSNTPAAAASPATSSTNIVPGIPSVGTATQSTAASNPYTSSSANSQVPQASGLVQAPPPPSLPSGFSSSILPSGATSSGSPQPMASGTAPGAAAAVGAKGITYSPYTKSDQCKSAQDVQQDIAKLTDFDIIRLYSTDCSGIENVLAAMTSSQQLFLGIWNIDTNSVQSGLSAIQSAVQTSSRGWGAVNTISIGNEQVNSGTATPAQIGAAISTAKSWLSSNAPQYTGPVVSVDTLVAMVANPDLCQYSDYLAVNCHPYWDGNVVPSNSGQWLQEQIQNLQNTCGSSKKVLITETGWPTQGKPFGNCVPSLANQVSAVKSIVSALGSQVIAFTMYNDYWKDPGPYGVESYWGLFGNPAE